MGALFDQHPIATLVWYCPTDEPTDVLLVAANRAAQDTTLVDTDDIVGRPLRELFPAAFVPNADGSPGIGVVVHRVGTTGVPAQIDDLVYANERIAETSYRLWIRPVGPRFAGAFYLNVTQSVQERRHLGERVEQLARDKAELSEAKVELERFTRTVAHDLKNPLSTIIGYGDLLPQLVESLPDEVLKIVARMRHSADRAARLIDELLEYARVTGTASGPMTTVDLSEAVEEARDTLASKVEASAAMIRSSGLPLVLGYRAAIRQVLVNLLDNALKYRHPGRLPDVMIGGRVDGDVAEIAVRDNGLGIPAEHRSDVFAIGRRLVTPHALVEGSGLGLSACQAIIERHGGRIWVSDSDDTGTTIRFTLPAVVIGSSAPGHPHLVDDATDLPTVLLTDDDPDVLGVLLLAARRAGVSVVGTATDGFGAVDLYTASMARPSLVVLDYSLPGLDGVEVARRILAEQPGQRVVIHTAHLDAPLLQRAHDVGVDECVAKDDVEAMFKLFSQLASTAAS